MCSVPETSRTSFSPAPTIFRSGWNTIGDGPTGSRCLFVTLVSSPSRVPLPPARITPRTFITAALPAIGSIHHQMRLDDRGSEGGQQADRFSWDTQPAGPAQKGHAGCVSHENAGA